MLTEPPFSWIISPFFSRINEPNHLSHHLIGSRGYHPPPFGRATKKAISLPTFFTLISTSVQKGPKEEHLTGKGSRQHQKTDLRSSIHLLVLRRIRSAHGWPPSGFRRNGKSPPCGASPSLMEQAVGEQLGSIQQGFLDSIIVLVLIPELLDP